jgi:hypothetical protein
MPLNLGSSAALLRLGSGSPSKVFLGSVTVLDVPQPPQVIGTSGGVGNTTISLAWPSNASGSALTGYRIYVDSALIASPSISGLIPESVSLNENYSGQVIEVSAVNAIGEGPKSDPVTVS